MKNLIFALLSLLIIFNCNAQKKNITSKKKYKMEIPNIKKEDIKIFRLSDLITNENRKILAKTRDSSQLINEYSKELNFEQNGFGSTYKNGKLTLLGKITEDDVQKPILRKNSNPLVVDKFTQRIQTLVFFYPNENIHLIKQFNNNSNGSYNAGNWYAYDEAGNLLQHIDHEKHFQMTYYDVTHIADSYDYPIIEIGRFFDEKNSFWRITLKGFVEEHPQRTKVLYLDDRTGKVVYETQQEEIDDFPGFKNIFNYSENLYRFFKNN